MWVGFPGMHNVFLSRGYTIFMYFVFHFDLTFGFHLTQMILLSTLGRLDGCLPGLPPLTFGFGESRSPELV